MQTSTSDTGGVLAAFSNELAAAVDKAGRSVVAVHARRRFPSSGILWRPGVVVTAAHTLERREEITVTLPSNASVPATLAGDDPGSDIAVLKIEDAASAAAELGDSASLQPGHVVLALGRAGEEGLNASFGFVGGVGGPWRTWRGGQIDRFLRPDLSTYPGFSGGPLVDARGRVAGMNTSGLSRRSGLTIPVETVERIADLLLTKGRVARGYLGIGLHPARLPQGGSGLVIVMVEPGGPAEQGGVLLGDILISVNEAPVGDTGDLQSALGAGQVGKPAELSILRGGVPAKLTVTVGERPRKEC